MKTKTVLAPLTIRTDDTGQFCDEECPGFFSYDVSKGRCRPFGEFVPIHKWDLTCIAYRCHACLEAEKRSK